MKNFYCPCCEFPVDKFRPGGADYKIIRDFDIVGMGRRLNKNCLTCSSNDRERMVYIYLRDYVFPNISQGYKILHIAPEKMIAAKLIQDKRITYIKGDMFDDHFYYPDTMQMDIRDISFPENSFDFIICNHVLEHIKEDVKAMSELYRVMKKGAKAILQVPISYVLKKTFEKEGVNTKEERIKYFGQRHHVRIYAWDYVDRLVNVGFQVEIVDLHQIHGEEFIVKNGLARKEKIIVCMK